MYEHIIFVQRYKLIFKNDKKMKIFTDQFIIFIQTVYLYL